MTLNGSVSYVIEREMATRTKGVPIPGVSFQRRYKHVNGSGVSASSRVLSHHYADEGEKGKGIRRQIRRIERRMWRDEWLREQFESEEFDYDVNEWFESEPLVWDWYDDDDYWESRDCGNRYCEICYPINFDGLYF